MRVKNLQLSNLGLEKTEEPEIKLPAFLDHRESKGMPGKKKSTSISSAKLSLLIVWIITNCGKLLKRWEYQAMLPVS